MIKARYSSHIRDAIADSALLGWALLVGWFLLLRSVFRRTRRRQVPQNDPTGLFSRYPHALRGHYAGRGRIKKCMMEKRDQLSQGCKDAVKTSMD